MPPSERPGNSTAGEKLRPDCTRTSPPSLPLCLMRFPRTVLTTLAMAVGLAVTAPQSQAQLLPSFGVTGGLNFASLSDAAGISLDDAVGYHIGAYGEFGFGQIGVRGSVLYVRAGNIAFPSPVPILGSDAAVEFIAIPIDLKYGAGIPLVNPYALVGPELRFPLGDLTDDPDSRSMAWAINLGVGAEIGAFIGPQLFAELRYAFDVTGFIDDANDSIRVSVFYLRIGIGI